MLFFIQL